MADLNKDGRYEVVVPFLDSIVIYDATTGNRVLKINRGVNYKTGVLVDDINSDGEYDLVFPKGNTLYAYRYDGTPLWEYQVNYYQISNSIRSYICRHRLRWKC